MFNLSRVFPGYVQLVANDALHLFHQLLVHGFVYVFYVLQHIGRVGAAEERSGNAG